MNLKCHNSALELAMLSIENKLIIFNLTVFNYTLSNSSIFNQAQDSIFLPQKLNFRLVSSHSYPFSFLH